MKFRLLIFILSAITTSAQSMPLLKVTAHCPAAIARGSCAASSIPTFNPYIGRYYTHTPINKSSKTPVPFNSVWCSQSFCNTPNWCRFMGCIFFGRNQKKFSGIYDNGRQK